jgi:hypothetical protein
VLASIKAGEEGWESKVPAQVAEIVKAKCLFGYPCETKSLEKDEKDSVVEK